MNYIFPTIHVSWPTETIRYTGNRGDPFLSTEARPAVVTWCVALPVSIIISLITGPFLDGEPFLVQKVVFVTLLIVLLMWVVMPVVARVAGGFCIRGRWEKTEDRGEFQHLWCFSYCGRLKSLTKLGFYLCSQIDAYEPKVRVSYGFKILIITNTFVNAFFLDKDSKYVYFPFNCCENPFSARY